MRILVSRMLEMQGDLPHGRLKPSLWCGFSVYGLPESSEQEYLFKGDDVHNRRQ